MIKHISKYSKLIVACLGIGATWLVEMMIIPPGSEEIFVTRIIEILMLLGIIVTPAKGYDGKW